MSILWDFFVARLANSYGPTGNFFHFAFRFFERALDVILFNGVLLVEVGICLKDIQYAVALSNMARGIQVPNLDEIK